jgi:broad specificity phosphatase PhoE
MRRAYETAELIAQAMRLNLRVDLRLRERLNWDGNQSIGEFLADWARAAEDRDLAVGGNESSRQAAGRLRGFLAAICRRPGP